MESIANIVHCFLLNSLPVQSMFYLYMLIKKTLLHLVPRHEAPLTMMRQGKEKKIRKNQTLSCRSKLCFPLQLADSDWSKK